MVLLSLKLKSPVQGGTFEAELEDGSSLIFSLDYISDSLELSPEGESPLFEAGRELSLGEEEAFRFAASCYKAEKAALRLIARAEQNSFVLASKLERRGYDYASAKAVVSVLRDRNLLNDERFAELWIRSRLALKKPVTPRWLLFSLGKRGIDKDDSVTALKNTLDPESEYEMLLRNLSGKRFSRDKKPWNIRAWLKSEGFSYESLDRYFNGG